jgi:malonate-semialdehyde dehydrogenase (acetylating)/methylmalonate-semialdehyde dehydrogenase
MSILEEPIKEVKVLKNYISGKWRDPENNGYLDVENPATREILAKVPLSTTKETNRAIDAAANAYPEWSATPVARRVRPLFKLNELLRANEEKLSRVLVSEMGKSIPDAIVEFKRVYENIEVAAGMPMLQQATHRSICYDCTL